jgi:ABC-type Fe3+ transport system substrate-binding protein
LFHVLGKVEYSVPTGFPEHQGSRALQAEPIVEEAQAIAASKNTLEEKGREATGKFKENKSTLTDGGNFGAAKAGAAGEARRMLLILWPLLQRFL